MMIRLSLALMLASVAMATNDTTQIKTFNITALDSTVTTLQYLWRQESECFYDQRQDVLTCVENSPYQNVTSAWKERPDTILYISVNCLTRGQYRGNTCVCKNVGSSSKEISKPDSYTPCQLTKLDEGVLRTLINLEVLDLSFNRIETVSKRAFTMLRKLKYLSLSNNNIKDIPSGFLCQVTAIEYLELNKLSLNSYPDQSFRCKENFTKLKVMEISGSNLIDIPADALDQLPALESLDLSNNSLKEVKKKAFSGGKMLKFLDLSHCNVSTLFPYFCDYLKHISRLYLHENNFETFDFALLEQCQTLVDLDLSSNNLSTLTGNVTVLSSLTSINLDNNRLKSLNITFDGMTNLATLKLSDNALEVLKNNNFVGLTNLTTLNLSRNSISNSENLNSAFSDLGSLQLLDLSYNKFARIPNNSFFHLNKLNQLFLSHNVLDDIRSLSFNGLNELETLALDNNLLQTLPGDIFHPFMSRDNLCGNGTCLHHLFLSHNNLTDVTNVYRWLPLVTLDVAHNKMTSLPSAIDFSRMEYFNVSHNRLESFFGKQENLAANFETMKTVDLSHNNIADIDVDKLHTMTNVEFLNLENNRVLFPVTNETFRGLNNLLSLNLAKNRIQHINNVFTDQSLQNLTLLDLSENPIQYLGNMSRNYNGSKVQDIILSKCNLSTLESGTFHGLLSLLNVDLRGNVLETFPPFFANVHAEYNLLDNPVVCACNMSWLREKYVNFTDSISKISVTNFKVPKCKVYTEKDFSYAYKLSRRQFMCPEVEGCHAQCECFKTEQNGSIITVSCRNDLRSVPKVSPTALYIFLDGNKFEDNTSLTNLQFTSNMAAKELYLNKSSISLIDANCFKQFERLEILNLANNLLTVLPSGLLKSQRLLKQLYLNDNLLTTIQTNVFNNLYSLQELDLSGNKLVYLSQATVTELSDLDYMKYYFLARNKWACDCRNLGFKDLIDDVLYRIRDRRLLVCGNSSKEIRYLPRSEFLCSEGENTHPSTKTLIIILLVTICVLLFVIAVFIYFRRELLSMFYYTTGCHIPGRIRYSGVHFDAYLTYDPGDQHCASYIHNTLMPKLKNNSYNVQTSSDVIQDIEVTKKVIEDSRCSIFIVDKNFSTNAFLIKVFLIATARHKVEKRHRVIVIIHGDVDLLTLEPELVSRMRKGDYITARSRLWWQRLVYELPEPSSGFRHGIDSEEEDVIVFSSLAEDQSQYEQF